MNLTKIAFFLSLMLILTNCNKSDDTAAAPTATTAVADGVGVIAQSVSVIGTSLGGGTSLMSAGDIHTLTTTPFTSTLCDSNGTPVTGTGGGNIADTAAIYPFLQTYCALTISSGETVKGGFSLVQGLICALEKGGIAFAGAEQTITINFSDTQCWPQGGPGGDSTSSVSITATGSAPASFNTHFEKGVIFSVASLGLTYKVAANLTTDKVEFIANENWSGTAAGTSAGNLGSMAGELTKSTGVLRFEKRDERVRADCTTSSCGWNRHTRIYATLGMVAGSPSSLTSFSYGYSNVDIPVTTLAETANNGYGKVVSASGVLASGIKARIFLTSSGRSLTQMKTVGQYSETVNTGCATAAGFNDASNCTSETGVDLFTASTKFTLVPNTGSPHTTPAAWLTSFTGFNFTSINLDTDNAF